MLARAFVRTNDAARVAHVAQWISAFLCVLLIGQAVVVAGLHAVHAFGAVDVAVVRGAEPTRRVCGRRSRSSSRGGSGKSRKLSQPRVRNSGRFGSRQSLFVRFLEVIFWIFPEGGCEISFEGEALRKTFLLFWFVIHIVFGTR